MNSCFVFSVGLCLCGLCLFAGAEERGQYKRVDGEALSFEIDLPQGEGPFPVVLYAHSWSGNLNQLKAYSQYMATRGVAGVRINYRKMSEGNRFVDAKQDILDAIEYVRDHAASYHLDMNRFGLAGASAGAVLTSLIAQETPDCISYIAFNGGFDLVHKGPGKFPDEKAMQKMFGDSFDDTVLRACSSIYNIRENPPDTLLLHGTEDTTIGPDQPERFVAALRAKGGQAKLVLYDGEEHGFFNSNRPHYQEIRDEVEEHLCRVFNLK